MDKQDKKDIEWCIETLKSFIGRVECNSNRPEYDPAIVIEKLKKVLRHKEKQEKKRDFNKMVKTVRL